MILRCAAAFVLLPVLGCDNAPPRSVAPTPAGPTSETSPAAAPTPTPKVPAPADLPICKAPAGDDPLAGVCKLGAPAAEARFECTNPSPLLFCGAFDEWSCRYRVFAGEEPPQLTHRARFDHAGLPLKTGEIIDDSTFERTGVVRGVSTQVRETDEAVGLAKAAAWTATLVEWGCVVSDEFGKTKVFSCGTWEAKTTYNEIIDAVIFEAAQVGFRECRG